MTSSAESVAKYTHKVSAPPTWFKSIQILMTYLLLIGISVLSLVPLFWMVSTSLKTKPEVYIFPPTLWAKTTQWNNYVEAWTNPDMQFTRWTLNSLLITVTVLVGVLLTASLVAYGFARIRFPGRNFWFMATLAALMLPPQVTLIPLYIIFFRIGWLDTLLPLTVPSWFGGGALNIFLLRQFFLNIPGELEDAARIDGAARLQIWWHIFLPLSRPALITVAIFTVVQTWTDFYGPLIYLSSQKNYTLALGMNLFRGTYTDELHYMMTIATIMTLPMLIIFFFLQRYYIQGVVLSGIKG